MERPTAAPHVPAVTAPNGKQQPDTRPREWVDDVALLEHPAKGDHHEHRDGESGAREPGFLRPPLESRGVRGDRGPADEHQPKERVVPRMATDHPDPHESSREAVADDVERRRSVHDGVGPHGTRRGDEKREQPECQQRRARDDRGPHLAPRPPDGDQDRKEGHGGDCELLHQDRRRKRRGGRSSPSSAGQAERDQQAEDAWRVGGAEPGQPNGHGVECEDGADRQAGREWAWIEQARRDQHQCRDRDQQPVVVPRRRQAPPRCRRGDRAREVREVGQRRLNAGMWHHVASERVEAGKARPAVVVSVRSVPLAGEISRQLDLIRRVVGVEPRRGPFPPMYRRNMNAPCVLALLGSQPGCDLCDRRSRLTGASLWLAP